MQRALCEGLLRPPSRGARSYQLAFSLPRAPRTAGRDWHDEGAAAVVVGGPGRLREGVQGTPQAGRGHHHTQGTQVKLFQILMRDPLAFSSASARGGALYSTPFCNATQDTTQAKAYGSKLTWRVKLKRRPSCWLQLRFEVSNTWCSYLKRGGGEKSL